jgi:hypothetical protein
LKGLLSGDGAHGFVKLLDCRVEFGLALFEILLGVLGLEFEGKLTAELDSFLEGLAVRSDLIVSGTVNKVCNANLLLFHGEMVSINDYEQSN